MKEIWKDIKGYEGYYQVSNLGRIKSLSRLIIKSNGRNFISKDLILKPNTARGYLKVALRMNSNVETKKIHRLVAETFIINDKNKSCVNHKDGNKLNNNIKNLEWCTYSENTLHAWEIGLNKNRTGEDKNSSKYSNNEVIILRHIYDNSEQFEKILGKKITIRYLARIIGFTEANASYIVNRKSWSNLCQPKDLMIGGI